MSGDSSENGETTFGETFVVPITGLLALLFAVLAGATAYPAVSSGSLRLAALPVIFGLSSLLCLRFRRRYVASAG